MIKINNLTYKYEDGTLALKDINMDLKNGECIGLIGANGSGKSTLFLNMMGILKPSKGSIEFKDKPLKYSKKSLRDYRKKVGIVFQDPEKQIFYSRVYDDIAFSLRNLDYSEEEIKRRVDKSLEMVGGKELEKKIVHFLSYGQKKRVAIAGSLVMDQEVLLLDEPTSGLDPNMTSEMKSIINELKKDKKLLISSHDMDFIYEICDYIYILKDGEILDQGKSKDIFIKTHILKTALLETPWLVKIHQNMGTPLYRSEKEFLEKNKKEV